MQPALPRASTPPQLTHTVAQQGTQEQNTPGTPAGCAPPSPQYRAAAGSRPPAPRAAGAGAVTGRVRSEGAAACPTLQAAVQSILTCSLSQEESRSAASALSRLHSKGEPTHITGDIHTLGHGTDRLWKNVL